MYYSITTNWWLSFNDRASIWTIAQVSTVKDLKFWRSLYRTYSSQWRTLSVVLILQLIKRTLLLNYCCHIINCSLLSQFEETFISYCAWSYLWYNTQGIFDLGTKVNKSVVTSLSTSRRIMLKRIIIQPHSKKQYPTDKLINPTGECLH